MRVLVVCAVLAAGCGRIFYERVGGDGAVALDGSPADDSRGTGDRSPSIDVAADSSVQPDGTPSDGGSDATTAGTVSEVLLGGSGAEEGKAITAVAGGAVVIAGTTTSFGSTSTDVVVARIDTAGTIEWTTILETTAADNVTDLVTLTDGDVLVVGSSMDATGFATRLAKLRAIDGTLVWSTTLTGPRPEIVGGAALPGNAAMLVGNTNIGTDALVVSIEALGVPQWSRSHGGGMSTNQMMDVASTSRGVVIVGAFGDQQWLIEIDPSGAALASGTFQRPINTVESVSVSADDAIIVTGRSSFTVLDYYVGRLNGTSPWIFSFVHGMGVVGKIHQATPGGGAVLVNTRSRAPDREIHVHQLSAAGAVAWEGTYTTSPIYYIPAMAMTTDGRLVLLGTWLDAASMNEIWLLSLDAGGLAEPTCLAPGPPLSTLISRTPPSFDRAPVPPAPSAAVIWFGGGWTARSVAASGLAFCGTG